jgi:hypothetical protein
MRKAKKGERDTSWDYDYHDSRSTHFGSLPTAS